MKDVYLGHGAKRYSVQVASLGTLTVLTPGGEGQKSCKDTYEKVKEPATPHTTTVANPLLK